MRDTTGLIGLRTFAIVAALSAAGCAVDVAGDGQQDGPGEGEVAAVSQALIAGEHAYTFYMKDRPLNGQDVHFTYATSGYLPTYTSAGTGRVTVHFTDLVGSYGNAQVSAVGSDSVRCKVQGWYVDTAGDRAVDVRCHNSAGTLANSDFAVYYQTAVSGSWGGAYLLVSNPTSLLGVSYSAPSGYSYNEFGGTNRVTRVSPGVYDNRLPGHGQSDGLAHVTAYGTGSEYCNVSSLSADGNDRIVRVRCFDTTGQPANAGYSLDYKPLGLPGVGGTGAHAIANNSTTSSYRPSTWYSTGACQPVPRDVLATRAANGKYNMRFNSMAAADGGIIFTIAQVSGYGTGPGYCKIGRDSGTAQWWLPTGTTFTDVEIGVRCYNDSGSLGNHQYVISFLTPWLAGYCNPMELL